jgi:hypothetical protein
MDDYERAAVGIIVGRGNRSTQRKPDPVPLCPTQIPHNLTRAGTQGRRSGKPATNRLSYGHGIIHKVTLFIIALTEMLLQSESYEFPCFVFLRAY